MNFQNKYRGGSINSKRKYSFSDFKTIVYNASLDLKQNHSFRTKAFNEPQKVTRKHRPDYKIPLFMSLLIMIGLVVIYSVSPLRANAINVASGKEIYSQTYFFTRYLIALALGVFLFYIAGKINLNYFKKFSYPILLAGFGLSIALLLLSKMGSNMALCTLGACRWLILPVIGSLQVAEALKFSLLLFFTVFWSYLAKNNQFNTKKNLIYSLPIILIGLFFIIVVQNDLGTGSALVVILAFMAFMAGMESKYIITTIVLIFLLGVGAILAEPHRMARLSTFLQGDNAAVTDKNRHAIEARIAIGSGGLIGLGVGKSIQATGYLPESINDSIFAVISEMFGFMGSIFILAIFLLLLMSLLNVTEMSQDPFGRILAAGVFGWIFSHVFINIASMIGLIPMTGITLPFLSHGGSSMIFIIILIGIVFNASRYTSHVKVSR